MLMNRQWTNTLATAGLTLLCSLAIVSVQLPKLSHLKVASSERSLPQLQQEVAQEAIELQLLQVVPNFGFDNLIANLSFIKFLIYFGDDPAREQTGYDLAPEYFNITLNEDPRFIPAYFGMSASVSLYLGKPEFSVEMMQKGLQSLSPKDPQHSYYIWRYLGTDQLLFLGDGEAAEKSFANAAQWAREYSDSESELVAQLSSSTAAFLQENPDSKQAQFQSWQLVLFNATDDKTRQRAISKMEELGGRVIFTPDGTVEAFIPPSSP